VNTFWVFDARIKVKISPLRSIPTSREDLSKAKGEWKVELSQPYKSSASPRQGARVACSEVSSPQLCEDARPSPAD
jgi:hypothetical protein